MRVMFVSTEMECMPENEETTQHVAGSYRKMHHVAGYAGRKMGNAFWRVTERGGVLFVSARHMQGMDGCKMDRRG